MESAKYNNIQLLATLVDPDDEEEGEYRFLVDGTRVKNVTVAPGTLPKDNRTFAPAVLAGLPSFPRRRLEHGPRRPRRRQRRRVSLSQHRKGQPTRRPGHMARNLH